MIMMRKTLLHLIYRIVLLILVLGVILVVYLFSDLEYFPIKSYDVVPETQSSTYGPTTWSGHIAWQSSRDSNHGTINYIDQ
jgi:hypothetical protein